MKPKIFLSHSKKDKKLIEEIANSLLKSRIDVWYDDWEIPPGESFTESIFSDGIPNCDLFFVYISINSINSYWVSQELDAAFINRANSKISNFAIFVDSDQTREKMRLDLQAKNSPVLSEETKYIVINSLISRTWEVFLKKDRISGAKEKHMLQLENENKLLKLKNEIQLLKEDNNNTSFDKYIKKMKQIRIQKNKKFKSLYEVFVFLKDNFASSVTQYSLHRLIIHCFKLEDIDTNLYKINMAEITGPLIIMGLLKIEGLNTEEPIYILTEKGIDFSNTIENH